jgi:uncharacterized membrane protein YidH (DUF202 family)
LRRALISLRARSVAQCRALAATFLGWIRASFSPTVAGVERVVLVQRSSLPEGVCGVVHAVVDVD